MNLCRYFGPPGHLLALLLLHITTINAQFLAFPGLAWTRTAEGPALTNTTALPSQTVGPHTLIPYEATLPANNGSVLEFVSSGGANLRNFGPQLYEVFKFWIEADSTDVQLELSCSYGGVKAWTGPITTWTTGHTINSGSWTPGSIDLAQFTGHIIDRIILRTSVGSTNNVRMRITGYAGNANGTDNAHFIDPVAPPTNLPAYNFTTQDQGGGFWNDQGLECVWACDVKPIRGGSELGDVFVQAYRDTTVGPLPMQLGHPAVKKDGVVEYAFLWSATDNRRAKAIAEWPNPFLSCLCQTADFFVIGNPQQATRNLTVWMPITTEPAINILMAYAEVVKQTRVNGRDDVSILVRMRIPNSMGGARSMPDYQWVQQVTPDCSTGADPWLCPDHIIFSNTQLGALNLGYNRLQAITDDNYQYFKRTGYDVAFDLHPTVDKLLYYSGEYYGVPAWINQEHWHLNTGAVKWLQANGKKAPPPIDDWGVNWQQTWDMNAFTEMAKTLNAPPSNRINIIPFASNNDMTQYFQYLVFRWGATMLDTQGRCGLLADDSAERALNETFVQWMKTPSLIQYRGPWSWDTQFMADFAAWKNATPKVDPLTEQVWNMADTSPWEAPLDGFATLRAYGGLPAFMKIYPPQGVARITAALIGLATTAKNATLAHEAMMIGFARNTNYKGNVAVYSHPQLDTTAWTSGYRSAFSTPDYSYMKTVMQLDDQALLCELDISFSVVHVFIAGATLLIRSKSLFLPRSAFSAFPGYPVQQSQAFGLVQPYDPMNLVFNEIQFKSDRVTVRQALEHACKIIDFLTLPPCTKDYLEVYISDNPGSNKGDLMYRWPANSVNVTCRLGVAKALTSLPPPIVAAVPLTYTSIKAPQAQAMVALCAAGIAFELVLMALFLAKKNTQVIKAASVKASLMIFVGACLTLSSVVMRVTNVEGNGWFQCWGTYYAFAIGYGLVLGALALKSYRIYFIFQNSKTMGKTFTDAKLMGSLSGIVLIELLLCLVLEFALSDHSTVRYVDLPGLNAQVEQYDCPTSSMGGVVTLYIVSTFFLVLLDIREGVLDQVDGKILTLVFFQFNVLLIIVAAYYAFRTRNVIAAFNENVFTSAAILLISVVTIVIVPVLTLITSSVAIFMLIALGTIIATILSTAIFAIPKVLYAFNVLHMANLSGALQTQGIHKSTTAGSGSENERRPKGGEANDTQSSLGVGKKGGVRTMTDSRAVRSSVVDSERG
ncbi:hypothetical protein HDV00_001107 [Rhizophlyctis rosea]|nr:hypothetical protein HDV00_001107 [Rhizophlyctis rosea]